MPQYDPQRSHPRRPVSDAEPVPVDALLEPHPADGDTEVVPVADELVVRPAGGDLHLDPAPSAAPAVRSGRFRLVAVLAAVVALIGLLVMVLRRRSR